MTGCGEHEFNLWVAGLDDWMGGGATNRLVGLWRRHEFSFRHGEVDGLWRPQVKAHGRPLGAGIWSSKDLEALIRVPSVYCGR